jgi:ABC-type glycerol-3-phosphate transport system substrate-binding protein
MKKFLALALTILFCLSFVSSVSAEEKPTLVYWDMIWSDDPNYEPTVRALCDKFTEETGIDVDLQMIAWDNHYQTFLTAINAGVGPDIATGGAYNAIYYSAMDLTLDLDSIVDEWKAEGSSILDDYLPGALSDHYYDGHLKGISTNLDIRNFFANKTYLEEAGYSVEQAQALSTWDEFLDMLRAIKAANPDVVPFIFPAGDYTAAHTLWQFSNANGVGVVNEEGKSNMTDPRWAETLEFFKTCYDEGLVSEAAASYVSDDIIRLFSAGEVAVAWCGTPVFINYQSPELQETTIFLRPSKGPSGDAATLLSWFNPIYAYNTTKYPEEAKQFIKWWVENDLAMYTDSGWAKLSPRASQNAASAEAWKNDWCLTNILALDLPSTARSSVWPAASIYPAIFDVEGNNLIGDALQAVLLGESDIPGLLEEADMKVAEAIANYDN